MKLDVIIIPVSDPDGAKAFYEAQARISAIGKPINKIVMTGRNLQFGNSRAGNVTEAI